MRKKSEGNWEFKYIEEERKSLVRHFTLKKGEITMLAKSQVEKLQAQLIFVSMADYNVVVEENRQLRKLVKNYEVKLKKAFMSGDPDWLSKKEVKALSGIKASEIGSYVISGQLKTKREGTNIFYSRKDVENLTSKNIMVQ